MPRGDPNVLLLPALDNQGSGGVDWNSVEELVKTIQDGNFVPKHVRYALKSRLSSGNMGRVLNTLTVVHTIGFNCLEDVRRQLSDGKFMRTVEKAYSAFHNDFLKAAVVQVFVDWAYVYSEEDLGLRASKSLKSLKARGAKPMRPTPVAMQQKEYSTNNISVVRFIRGVDFGFRGRAIGISQDAYGLVSPRVPRGTKFGRLATRIFRRSPSLPVQVPEAQLAAIMDAPPPELEPRVDSWVDEMLAQMPGDARKLSDLVKEIRVLLQKGGADNDIQNKYAIAQSLALKCKGWGEKVKQIVAAQVEGIAQEIGTAPDVGLPKTPSANPPMDPNTITRVLETNDNVLMAVKAWDDIDGELSQEEHSHLKEGLILPLPNSHTPSATSVVDVIREQLQAAQVSLDNADSHDLESRMTTSSPEPRLDSSSSAVTPSHCPYPQCYTPSNPSALWVDFSDSSGSQMLGTAPDNTLTGVQGFFNPFNTSGSFPEIDSKGSARSASATLPATGHRERLDKLRASTGPPSRERSPPPNYGRRPLSLQVDRNGVVCRNTQNASDSTSNTPYAFRANPSPWETAQICGVEGDNESVGEEVSKVGGEAVVVVAAPEEAKLVEKVSSRSCGRNNALAPRFSSATWASAASECREGSKSTTGGDTPLESVGSRKSTKPDTQEVQSGSENREIETGSQIRDSQTGSENREIEAESMGQEIETESEAMEIERESVGQEVQIQAGSVARDIQPGSETASLRRNGHRASQSVVPEFHHSNSGKSDIDVTGRVVSMPAVLLPSLSGSGNSRKHRIPALRVRFTQEHVNDIVTYISKLRGRSSSSSHS